MKRIRIGNDIAISWSILDAEGSPYSLEGRNIRLYMDVERQCSVRVDDFTIDGNVISFLFAGKQQKSLGRYALRFVENIYETGMTTFDLKDAFEIVAHSWQEGQGDTTTIETETVELTSQINASVGSVRYSELPDKPQINGNTLVGNKSASDLGLATPSDVAAAVEGKVDKVQGKGLSTNDYTTAEKEKLSGIQAGAQKNLPNTVTDASYVHTDNNYTTAEKTKLAGLSNYDDSDVKERLDDIEGKEAGWDAKANVDDIPDVIDNVTSTSTDGALSANQGKLLNDRINNILGRGRFLSFWDATTGMPLTNPSGYPYEYRAGDFFIVNKVGETNYIPNGATYTGQPSTTVYTGDLKPNDSIYYDGTQWMVFDTPAGSGDIQDVYQNGASVVSNGIAYVVTPTDLKDLNADSTHRVVTDVQIAAWNAKQDAISDLATIRSNASAGKSASDTISGYGNIVTHNASEFATAAQGALAETALQAVPSTYRTAAEQDVIDEEKEDSTNKVTSISSSSTDKQYPSAKAVYSAIQGAGGEPDAYIKSASVSSDGNTLTLVKKDDSEVEFSPKGSGISIATTIPTGGMLPDVFYAIGEITADPNITLASAPSDGKDHEWMLTFSIGATAPASVTFPSNVQFPDTATFAANKHYEVSMKWDANDNKYYGLIQTW